MTPKEELINLIQLRNKEIRKDHERRYGKILPEEPREAYERRILETPSAWERI